MLPSFNVRNKDVPLLRDHNLENKKRCNIQVIANSYRIQTTPKRKLSCHITELQN